MENKNGFIPLDSASLIYPATESKYYNSVFRLSVDVKFEVNPVVLQEALEDVIQRVKTFNVKLKRGFFWYYFEKNSNTPVIHNETSWPVMKMNRKKNNDFLFKVFWSKHRIAVEFFHALCDGTGGNIFLMTLVARYLELKDIKVDSSPLILRCSDKEGEWENRDCFRDIIKRDVTNPGKIGGCHHVRKKGGLTEFNQAVSGKVDVDIMLKFARNMKYTINEIFTALLIMSIIEEDNPKKPVMISVPLNMRNIYNQNTLRNFSLFAIVGVDPGMGDYTFEEIIERVHLTTRLQLDRHYLDTIVKRNVAVQLNPFVRCIPIFVKNPFFKGLSELLGEFQYTSTISNMGKIKVPKQLEDVIDRYDFFISSSQTNPVGLAVASIGNTMTVNFASILMDNCNIERRFFSHLVEWGIPVEIKTNRQEGEK